MATPQKLRCRIQKITDHGDHVYTVAGRTGQEYNQRKDRKGAFWEDRYHATAIESGEHLLRCIVYIDLNMVRAGIVDHPSQWPFCGYNEIQEPRRKNVLINHEKLRELAGAEFYDLLKRYHQGWVEKYLGNGNNIRFESPQRLIKQIAWPDPGLSRIKI
jgi:putative transposase